MTCNLHVHIYKHNLATQVLLYILLHKLVLLNVDLQTDVLEILKSMEMS